MLGFDVRRATWGVVLVLVGMFLLFERFVGLPEWVGDYAWWGSVVVLIGLVTLVTARRAESVGSGVTIALIGFWIFLVTNHVLGLSWYNSWPLALVSVGAGTVAHAIAANWLPDTPKEQRRRRRERFDEQPNGDEETGHA